MDEDRTRTLVASEIPRGDDDAARLLRAALDALAWTPRCGSLPGYRVFWMERSEAREGLAWRDVVADGLCHVVVGRHPEAHVHLGGAPEVGLRQLLLRAEVQDGATLLTAHGLGSEAAVWLDDRPMRGLTSVRRGPVLGRVASRAFCALPFDGCAATDGGPGSGGWQLEAPPSTHLRRAMLPPDFLAQLEGLPGRPPRAIEPTDADALEADLRDDRAPRLRASMRSWMEAEEVGTRQGSTSIERLEITGLAAVAEVSLFGRHGHARVPLSEPHLQGMVLVGRYARCLGAGRPVFSDAVSRIHVGILRTGSALEVLDLASSNGITVAGRKVHRVAVEGRAVIELSEGERIEVRTL